MPDLSDGLRFRRTSRDDLPQIRRWLQLAHVERYWAHDTSEVAVARDFAGSFEGTEPSEDFIIELDAEPIGFIQRCFIHDYPVEHSELIDLAVAPVRSLTIDYFIGEPDMLGRGLATQSIRAFSTESFAAHSDAPAIIVPVITGNTASWSALASAGFRRIATGYLTPDSPLDDGQHHVYRLDRPPLTPRCGSAER